MKNDTKHIKHFLLSIPPSFLFRPFHPLLLLPLSVYFPQVTTRGAKQHNSLLTVRQATSVFCRYTSRSRRDDCYWNVSRATRICDWRNTTQKFCEHFAFQFAQFPFRHWFPLNMPNSIQPSSPSLSCGWSAIRTPFACNSNTPWQKTQTNLSNTIWTLLNHRCNTVQYIWHPKVSNFT